MHSFFYFASLSLRGKNFASAKGYLTGSRVFSEPEFPSCRRSYFFPSPQVDLSQFAVSISGVCSDTWNRQPRRYCLLFVPGYATPVLRLALVPPLPQRHPYNATSEEGPHPVFFPFATFSIIRRHRLPHYSQFVLVRLDQMLGHIPPCLFFPLFRPSGFLQIPFHTLHLLVSGRPVFFFADFPVGLALLPLIVYS